MKSNINTKENVFCTKLHEPATAIFASDKSRLLSGFAATLNQIYYNNLML